MQLSEKAVDPPGDAREDWTILRALSDVLGKPLPFDSFAGLRAALFRDHPDSPGPGSSRIPGAAEARRGRHPQGHGIVYPIEDFYLTNPIARASPTLQRCSAEIFTAKLCGGGGMSASA